MCGNLGGGSKSGVGASSAIKNQLAGNKADLEYAQMKAKEYGNVKGGGTMRTREQFELWNDEVKRLQEDRTTLETKQKAMDKLTKQLKSKSETSGESFTLPQFKLNNDGNIEFEYKGTKTQKREKGGKMQSATKADTVEVTSRYYGVIRVSGNKAKIERHSQTESEKTIKKGRL